MREKNQPLRYTSLRSGDFVLLFGAGHNETSLVVVVVACRPRSTTPGLKSIHNSSSGGRFMSFDRNFAFRSSRDRFSSFAIPTIEETKIEP
jgi:hypothetical protein